MVRCGIDSRGIASVSGFIMSIRFKLRGIYLALLLISSATLSGEAQNHESSDSGSLRQHYNDAQKLQQVGKLSEAAEQYRAFLADALGELAIGYSLVPDYTHAAPLFDEALSLEPDSPSLLLDYAQTALGQGDLAHAKTLATEFIRSTRVIVGSSLGPTSCLDAPF